VSFEDGAADQYPDVLAVRDYIESDEVYSIAHEQGFYGRYSAPGYTDATDYTWGATEDEVMEELYRLYGDDTDEAQNRMYGDDSGGAE
jgi:hypothetical protein